MEPRIQGQRHQLEPLSYKVIGACIDVQRQLGTHCMEADDQLVYDGVTVTKRRVAFKCWDAQDMLSIETKAAQAIRPEDAEQSLLYVTKGNQKLVLLVNFGEKPLRPRRFVNTSTFQGEAL